MRAILNLDKILVSLSVIAHDDGAKQSGTDIFRSHNVFWPYADYYFATKCQCYAMRVTLTIFERKLY